MMQIILKEDVPNLGMVGDLVRVRDGYGRNFLIPQGKAILASSRSVAELTHQKRVAAHHKSKATTTAQANKATIEKLSIVMYAKIATVLGEQAKEDHLAKLFGSITSRDLERVIAGASVKVDHRRITLSEHVRTVGKFVATIRLDGGITATLPFWVLPEGTTDVEGSKKQVEAAQEVERKRAEELANAERAKAALLMKSTKSEAKTQDAAERETKADDEDKAEASADATSPAGGKKRAGAEKPAKAGSESAGAKSKKGKKNEDA